MDILKESTVSQAKIVVEQMKDLRMSVRYGTCLHVTVSESQDPTQCRVEAHHRMAMATI